MLSTCIARFIVLFSPFPLFSLIARPGGNRSTGEPRRCLVVCFSALGSGHLDRQRDISRPSRMCFLRRRLAPFTRLFTGLSPYDASVPRIRPPSNPLPHTRSAGLAHRILPHDRDGPPHPVGLVPFSSQTLSSPRDGIDIRWPGPSELATVHFLTVVHGKGEQVPLPLLVVRILQSPRSRRRCCDPWPSVFMGKLDKRGYSFSNAIQP